ncbi:MAG TPA: PD-(D/E)XK nuclease family protein [Candidatus Binataceae bacterium]|nr:PD-(D/E)XK nuclease family protein [Candidatus Binataceae bacterium]
MANSRKIIVSHNADDRLAAARGWLERLAPGTEALVVAPVREAADDLVRQVATGRGALLGAHRMTLSRLAGLLAADRIAALGLAPADGLATEAIAARAIFKLAPSGALKHFQPVVGRPGFSSALSRTIAELRLNSISPAQLKTLGDAGAAIAVMLDQFDAELADAKLIDRAGILKIAAEAARANPQVRFIGIPAVLLDLPLEGALDRELVASLAAAAPALLATSPAGDSHALALLESALEVAPQRPASSSSTASIENLRQHLFADTTPPARELDDTVTMVSAPGEMHECVEIARRIVAEARRGIPFDRIAVLLNEPARYVPYLQEALGRAGIPAYFARGTRRPEPGGRAMLALLACAAENLSARRFSEYLSLAQIPEPGVGRGDAVPAVLPGAELSATSLKSDFEIEPEPELATPEITDPAPVVDGTVRAPWRWERLLVDAAVIGSAERWERRLKGLESEFRRQESEIAEHDARAAGIRRNILDLRHLRETAVPILSALGDLPRAAAWGDWLGHFRGLAELAIRDQAAVLAALAELEPMAPVGPVGIGEVRLVLGDRLGRLESPPANRRYGCVFVATPHRARGMFFDVAIAPGLAERIFPRKVAQDPILPDADRARLGSALARNERRVDSERLALRIVAGAATSRVMFSYPRVDLDQGRPRVPSFYALEILRAAEGRLPGFDELARRAAGGQSTRLGWPAPIDPSLAIDDAEFDLAVLDRLVDEDPGATVGAANYLLDANPHLARALRARARRWLRRWTSADGLVDPDQGAKAALARHQLSARPYSPTALQNFSACPYRFLLQAIHRLEPREEPEAIDAIDPLTRGGLFHEVQYEVLTALRDRGALPVMPGNLDGAQKLVDELLETVAARWHDELAPAIERVWSDGIDSIRADLREWLRRAAHDPEGWRPESFELSFGLPDRAQADPNSSAAPVALEGGLRLRGAIDLIERDGAGRLRVTDHKTGKVRADKNFVLGGGKTLQPVLYALAAEHLLKSPIHSGRLYYCTAAGGYEERVVEIGDEARASTRDFTAIVGGALNDGFFPAAPAAGECRWCDYQRVCGPYEERRVAIKPRTRLEPLFRLRTMR